MAADPAAALRAACAAALTADAATPLIEQDGRWTTRGELLALAEDLQTLIDASGVGGAPIAFVPRNRPAAIAALIGMVADGRSIRMVYAFQSPEGIARDISASGAALAVVADEDVTDALVDTLRAAGIAVISLAGMAATAIAGLERGTPGAPPGMPDIQILTSGTTGPPKRFAIAYATIQRMVAGNMLFAAIPDPLTVPPLLLFVPLGNISGLYVTLPAILAGLRLTLLDRFTIPGWLDHLRRYRPAQSGMPPAAVQMLLEADIPREDLACLQSLGTGAAPLDPGVHRAFEDRYGIPVLLSYGATEFGGPVAAMTAALHGVWGAAKFGSVGRALPGARLRIVDPATGDTLPAGAEGLLEVVAPLIGPEWIRTADIAILDADSFLFHRGRADGAIMRGGFKLLPETIERALCVHPAVAAAAVIAVADRRLGQVPAAAVQIAPGATPPAIADLEAHLRAHLYATHIPAHWRFVDALPLTPSMKVSRPALHALFAAPPG